MAPQARMLGLKDTVADKAKAAARAEKRKNKPMGVRKPIHPGPANSRVKSAITANSKARKKKFNGEISKTLNESSEEEAEASVAKKIMKQTFVEIIINFELGTTFSTYSWASTSGSKTLDAIHTNKDWEGCEYPGVLEKAPSQLARAEDNPGLPKDRMGYLPKNCKVRVAWYKLLFAADGKPKEADDPLLRQSIGQELMRLLPGMQPIDAIELCYKLLNDHAMETLPKRLPGIKMEFLRFRAILTMPATYDNNKRRATIQAAERAGIGKGPLDRIEVISEPEAAAMLAIYESISQDGALCPFKSGQSVTVVDIGGGSIDVITLAILRLDPVRLAEACVREGRWSGATAAIRAFYALCIELFGDLFTQLPKDKTDAGSELMAEVGRKIKSFTGEENHEAFEFYLPAMANGFRTQNMTTDKYDATEGSIKLSRQDMEGLYKVIIAAIFQLVREQLEEGKKSGEPEPKVIILVGGLAMCKYIQAVVRRFCEVELEGRLMLVIPDQPWSAVSRGAVLRGLIPHIMQSRRSRHHVGSGVSRVFVQGKDREEDAFRCPSDGHKRAGGYVEWIVHKGDQIKPLITTKAISTNLAVRPRAEVTKFDVAIYIYEGKLGPKEVERIDDEGVQEIGKILGSFYPSANFQKKHSKNIRDVYVDIKVEIVLEGESGLLEIRALHKKAECGSTKVDYVSEAR